MSESVFKQQLRGLERYFFRCPNSNLVIVTRIKGAISSEQLETALSKLRKKYPLLRVKISLDNRNIAWLTSEGVPENSVHAELRAADDPDAWIRKVSEEQKERFQLDKGPLIRFALLNSAETSDLIINCHHSICDALSLTYLVRDILFSITNPEWEPAQVTDVPDTQKAGLPSPHGINLHHRIIVKILNILWRRNSISFSEADFQILHQKYWGKGKGNHTLSWELTESQTSAFVNRCRKENVTVNSAIATAVVAAQHDVQGTRPAYLHTVSMPVDIRKRLSPPVGEAFGLYVSTVKADLTYALGIKRRLTNSSVFMLLHKANLLHPSLIDALYFSKYGLLDSKIASFLLRLSGIHRMNAGWEISNLGRCDLPINYGSLKLEAIILPVFLSDYQEKCLRIVTVGGRMFFSLTFWEDILDTLTAERIRDTSMRYVCGASCW